MALLRPVWMQQTGADAAIQYSALELRNLVSSMTRAEGVLQAGFAVTQRGAGANFSVDVAAGFAIVNGDDVAGQGMYLIRSDATANVATPGAPASGTRVHRLVAQVRDKFHNGAYSTYEFTLDVLQDTGSGTPAVPNSAIPLARISIAAGQGNVANANITDDRPSAALVAGQYRQVGSDSGRPAAPYVSELVWRTDKGYLEMWTGTAWLPTTSQISSTALSFNSGFVNHSFGYAASYRFVGPNMIHLAGTIAKSGGAAFATNDVPITLPAGLRPASQQGFICAAESMAADKNVRVDVMTSGNLTVVFNTSGYTPHWVSLDSIQVRLA